MYMRKTQKIQITDEERAELITMSRSQVIESRYVLRARIILLSDQGKTFNEIMNSTCASHNTVNKWRKRFIKYGIAGLDDKPRPGRVPLYTPEEKANVIKVACSNPEGGYTSWSQQRIAEKTGISKSHVNRILKEASLKPHKTEYWCGNSNDPEFEEKMINIVAD